jgi:hypothetical protein
MRKLILIAGFVLASATAQAGDNRSLSLSGSDVTAPAPAPAKTTEAPKSAEAPQAEAPRYVERPAVVESKAETPKGETPKAEASKAAAPRLQRANVEPGRRIARDTRSTRRFERPLRKRWIEARIIHALHRYGIYW